MVLLSHPSPAPLQAPPITNSSLCWHHPSPGPLFLSCYHQSPSSAPPFLGHLNYHWLIHKFLVLIFSLYCRVDLPICRVWDSLWVKGGCFCGLWWMVGMDCGPWWLGCGCGGQLKWFVGCCGGCVVGCGSGWVVACNVQLIWFVGCYGGDCAVVVAVLWIVVVSWLAFLFFCSPIYGFEWLVEWWWLGLCQYGGGLGGHKLAVDWFLLIWQWLLGFDGL